MDDITVQKYPIRDTMDEDMILVIQPIQYEHNYFSKKKGKPEGDVIITELLGGKNSHHLHVSLLCYNYYAHALNVIVESMVTKIQMQDACDKNDAQ